MIFVQFQNDDDANVATDARHVNSILLPTPLPLADDDGWYVGDDGNFVGIAETVGIELVVGIELSEGAEVGIDDIVGIELIVGTVLIEGGDDGIVLPDGAEVVGLYVGDSKMGAVVVVDVPSEGRGVGRMTNDVWVGLGLGFVEGSKLSTNLRVGSEDGSLLGAFVGDALDKL